MCVSVSIEQSLDRDTTLTQLSAALVDLPLFLSPFLFGKVTSVYKNESRAPRRGSRVDKRMVVW